MFLGSFRPGDRFPQSGIGHVHLKLSEVSPIRYRSSHGGKPGLPRCRQDYRESVGKVPGSVGLFVRFFAPEPSRDRTAPFDSRTVSRANPTCRRSDELTAPARSLRGQTSSRAEAGRVRARNRARFTEPPCHGLARYCSTGRIAPDLGPLPSGTVSQ